jgi:hypothetical protein
VPSSSAWSPLQCSLCFHDVVPRVVVSRIVALALSPSHCRLSHHLLSQRPLGATPSSNVPPERPLATSPRKIPSQRPLATSPRNVTVRHLAPSFRVIALSRYCSLALLLPRVIALSRYRPVAAFSRTSVPPIVRCSLALPFLACRVIVLLHFRSSHPLVLSLPFLSPSRSLTLTSRRIVLSPKEFWLILRC